MAIIRFAEGQQRSGSTGGSVYSRNRFGQYIRARSTPVNPNTDLQVAVRNFTRSLAIAWNNTLTQAQRDAWETYAANVVWKNKLGDSIYLTGLNHYVRSNTPRLQAGLSRVDAAPTLFTLATAELDLVVTATEAGQTLSVAFDDTAAWCSENGAFQSIAMGLPVNAAKTFFGGPFRYCSVIAGDSVTPPTSPVTPAVVFPVAQNQRIWVRTRIGRADGRLSEFAQINFLCGA